jgi:transglutaminase-like putative cysteine protease
MNLPRTFLAMTYLLVLISIVAHELAADQYVFMAITPVLLIVAYRLEASGRPLRLPEPLPTLLTLGAFILVMSQGIDRESLVQLGMFDVQVATVGKFLIAFQWISLFRDKGPRDYGWVYLVTVVQMGIAGLLMPSLGYGGLLLLYALCGVAAMTVFHLWTQALAAGADMEHEVKVSGGLLFSAVPMVLMALPPLAAIFMALPRQNIRAVSRFSMGRVQAVAGFSDSVELGEVGSIQDNPQRVMTVAVSDPETRQPMDVADILLRGVVLEKYENDGGRWTWRTETLAGNDWAPYWQTGTDVARIYRHNFPEFFDLPYQLVKFDITMERASSSLIFTQFAAENIVLDGRRWPEGNRATHIFRKRPRDNAPFHYQVTSRLLRSMPEGVEPPPPADFEDLVPFLEVPPEISDRVVALAQEIAPVGLTQEERARRIYNYLSDPSRFAYTLNLEPTPGIEPVEDFLFNRRVGHCEYFASAMALMLRCVGIPSRLVNGFKVWEYAPLQQQYIVRQSNAHSWVEAYVRPSGWRTYDPSVQREEVAEGGSSRVRFRNFYDAVDSLWNRYVINYSQDHRAAVSESIQRVVFTLRRFWEYTLALVAGELFSGRVNLWGAIKSFLATPLRILGLLCVFGGVAAALLHTIRVSRRLWAGREKRASIKYYRRMEQLLVRKGRHRRRSQTPWEFHKQLLAQDWPETDAVALVTECFCRARYAGHALSMEKLAEVRSALRRIAMGRRKRKKD